MTSESSTVSVITGGAGFVGSNLANRLLSAGHRVVLFDNLSRPQVARNVRWLRQLHGDRVSLELADIRNAQQVTRVISGADHVFHFAAQVAVTTSLKDPREDFDVNARGTLNVLEAARRAKDPPHMVFTSTNKVYGTLPHLPLRGDGKRYVPSDPYVRTHGIGEDWPLDFHSPYGCSKGAADQYVLDYARSFDLPAAVLRMSCIYGPRQFGNEDQGWVAHFLISAMREHPITVYGDGRQVRDILFVEDLVDAMQMLGHQADKLAGRAFNIGGGPTNAISLLELLDVLEKIRGRAIDLSFSEWRVGDQRYYVSDNRKLQEATGWQPTTSVSEGLVRLHDWVIEAEEEARGQRALVSRA